MTVPSTMKDNCWYCGSILIPGLRKPDGKPHPQMKTRDHFIPKSQKGKNKIPCCFQCNSRKGARSIERFRAKCIRCNWLLEGGKFWFETQGYEWVEWPTSSARLEAS